jgi:hypothetical protein
VVRAHNPEVAGFKSRPCNDIRAGNSCELETLFSAASTFIEAEDLDAALAWASKTIGAVLATDTAASRASRLTVREALVYL